MTFSEPDVISPPSRDDALDAAMTPQLGLDLGEAHIRARPTTT